MNHHGFGDLAIILQVQIYGFYLNSCWKRIKITSVSDINVPLSINWNNLEKTLNFQCYRCIILYFN